VLKYHLGYSFSQRQKLLTREISDLFQNGRRYKTPCFILIYKPASQSKLGIAIAKKHLAKATQRNRVKRLIREQFRLLQHTWHFSVIICSHPYINVADEVQIKTQLQACWDHLYTKV
jgi:ribonuclease P protein component